MELNIYEILLFIAIQLICFSFFMIVFWTYCIVMKKKITESFNILAFSFGVAISVVAAKFITP